MHDQPSVERLPTNAPPIGTKGNDKTIRVRALDRAQFLAGLGIPNPDVAVLVARRGNLASIAAQVRKIDSACMSRDVADRFTCQDVKHSQSSGVFPQLNSSGQK